MSLSLVFFFRSIDRSILWGFFARNGKRKKTKTKTAATFYARPEKEEKSITRIYRQDGRREKEQSQRHGESPGEIKAEDEKRQPGRKKPTPLVERVAIRDQERSAEQTAAEIERFSPTLHSERNTSQRTEEESQRPRKTYYHAKDIAFLLHEPLMKTFRELRAHERKIKKAKAKKHFNQVDRLREHKPMYTLDHLVKERYPTFLDALRDLDDCLTLVHLFALLPAAKRHGIPQDIVAKSRELSLEFQSSWPGNAL